ncbi:PP2C family protein-serine/threonine phosphatase [Actinomadura sp. 9N407]|uniref:PP2C family protein-serine/threonine phosphatase n=1 Tax=Actinomadura sp. 9N407 TaxID=3375154 RepID=UPI00378F715D
MNGDGIERNGEHGAVPCAGCGEPLDPYDRFCELCGRPRPVRPRSVVEIPDVRPSAVLETSSKRLRQAPPARCGDCGGTGIDPDGFCELCGLRQPTGNEHVEIELCGPFTGDRPPYGDSPPNKDAPPNGNGPFNGNGRPSGNGWDLVRAAGVSDLGHRRNRNEDAIAMAALPRTVCAVVCDGVASAPGSDQAAQVAADTGAATLVRRLEAGDGPESATRGALEQASRAVADLADSRHNPPACTYVSAVVERQTVTVGWIGDSRAYWIAEPGGPVREPETDGRLSVQLTRDDSWADLMIARRRMSEDAARADPRAHLLTGWLGSDAGTFAPHAITFRPGGSGVVVVCSDGLWNHLPEASTLAEIARASAPEGDLLAVARRLVQAALDAGGHDNVTVALIPFPPLPRSPQVPDHPDEPSREPLE